MKFLAALLIFATASASFAGNGKTLCGVNLPNGDEIRLEIALDKKDAFSPLVIKSINGETPKNTSEDGASGFGYKGYEHIALNLENSCKGKAEYSYYDASSPMNPMRDLDLICICK